MPITDFSAPRRTAATTLACALALAGVTLAHAHAREDAPPHTYGVQLQLAVHGRASAPSLQVEENKPFAVAGDEGGKPWRAEFVLERAREGATVRIAAVITEDGKTLARPTLVGALGERMAVRVGDDLDLALVVKDLAP